MTKENKDFLAYIKSGKQQKIYEELILSLRGIGLDTAFISVLDRSENEVRVMSASGESKKVPFLTIWIRTDENYKSLNLNEYTNNWGAEYPGTNDIRQMWRDLLVKYRHSDKDIKSKYDGDMVIYFKNAPKWLICLTVYDAVDELIISIGKHDVIRPVKIYCCSLPGYNIIYTNKADYCAADKSGQFDMMSDIIKNEIKTRIPEEYRRYVDEFLKIKFYHPKMKGFNIYVLAKQD